jgi:hypothetical protein
MKKIYMILALVMISVWSWAEVSITVNPKVIDFGTVNLNEKGEAEPDDYALAELDYTLAQWVYNVCIDTVGVQDPNCEFSAVADSGKDFWYDSGYSDKETTVWVSFYAIAEGDYQIKYHFYSWEDYNWEKKVYGDELTVKVKVLPYGETTGLESREAKVESRKIIRNGQLEIIRNGERYSLTGTQIR